MRNPSPAPVRVPLTEPKDAVLRIVLSTNFRIGARCMDQAWCTDRSVRSRPSPSVQPDWIGPRAFVNLAFLDLGNLA